MAIQFDNDSFKWSKEEYSLKGLLERFDLYLPFAIIVTEGYFGREEVGPDEMYWLREIINQERVVGRNEHDQYFSIPLCYSEKVIPYRRCGAECQPMTVEELVQGLGNYTHFQFQSKTHHIVTKHTVEQKPMELGKLEIRKTYNERFLVTHLVINGEEPMDRSRRTNDKQVGVRPKFELLPVCLPISVAIALDTTESVTETFDRTMYNFKEFLDKQPKHFERRLEQIADIMILDGEPADGDYEYIHFMDYKNHGKQTDSMPNDDQPEKSHTETDTKSNSKKSKKSKKSNKKSLSLEHRPRPNAYENVYEVAPPTQRVCSMFPPEVPDRTGPNAKDKQMEEEYTHMATPFKTYANVVETALDDRVGPIAFDLDPELVLSELYHTLQSGNLPTSPKMPKQEEQPQDHPGPATKPRSTPGQVSPSSSLPPPPLPKRAVGQKTHTYKTSVIPSDTTDLAEIPLNIGDFTVGDVAKCLEVLKLQQHIDKFVDEDIDGVMLQNLTKENLMEHFKIDNYSAGRLVQFATGWRPKRQ